MILFAIPGPTSLLIVLVIVLLLFGSRLPSTMRSLGRGVTEFKKGLAGEGEDDDAPKVKGDDKQPPAQ
jgi:sec-independent protein translocase protein TatA